MSSKLAVAHKNKFQVRPLTFTNLHHKWIGYAGYIKGVKSENVFGTTYGKTTLASQAQSFHAGRDEPAHVKYTTTMKEQFINHLTV